VLASYFGNPLLSPSSRRHALHSCWLET